jgi:hypothetical protein
MNGLFSPNFRVLNEPRYLRSWIRMIMRCLSSCLSTVRTLAGINVIAAPSTSDFSESNAYNYRIYACLGFDVSSLLRRIELSRTRVRIPKYSRSPRPVEILQHIFRSDA